MSVLRPLPLHDHAPDLPHPDADSVRAFLGAFHRAAVLPAGARLFRYGLRLAGAGSGVGAWVPMTEARIESADDALRLCSGPEAAAADEDTGDDDPARDLPTPVRDQFEAAADLPVWVGEAGILVRRIDVDRGSLRPVGVPVPLSRVRPLR